MSGNKKVIIILVVLTIVFGVIIGFGYFSGGEDGAFNRARIQEKVDALKGWFRGPPLPAEEIRSKCLKNGVFTIASGSSCQAVIQASDTSVRVLTLELLQGAEAKIVYTPHDEGAARVDGTIKKKKPFDLPIQEKGGNLTLSYTGNNPQQCRIRMKE